jgi:hypothetical protein
MRKSIKCIGKRILYVFKNGVDLFEGGIPKYLFPSIDNMSFTDELHINHGIETLKPI